MHAKSSFCCPNTGWFEQAWEQSGRWSTGLAAAAVPEPITARQQEWYLYLRQQRWQWQTLVEYISRLCACGCFTGLFPAGLSATAAATQGATTAASDLPAAAQQRNWRQAGFAVRHPPSVLGHLAVLDLPSDAVLQRAQLKAAFHKAAMRWHPDMHVGDSLKVAAEAKFKPVKEAYENLVLRAMACQERIR